MQNCEEGSRHQSFHFNVAHFYKYDWSAGKFKGFADKMFKV